VRIWPVVIILGVAMASARIPAETLECASLAINGGTTVSDPGCHGGRGCLIDLRQLKNNAVIQLPLPHALGSGKHRLVLRLRFEPADAYADSFSLSTATTAAHFMPSDDADPTQSDFRLWTLNAALEEPIQSLQIVLHRPPTAEPKTSSMILDCLRMEDDPDPVFIESVRMDKVLYVPLEEARCETTVFNASSLASQRRLRVVEEFDFSGSREVAHAEVEIPAHARLTTELRWGVGQEQYGREARVEVHGTGAEPTDAQSDFFAVADNVWKVAVRAPHGPHMTDPDSVHCPYKSDQAWKEFLTSLAEQIHGSYGNFSEMFAWAPDDAFDMTPTQQKWISGQGGYQHLKTRIIELNQLYNQNGVWPITYAKSAASGPPSFDFMRRHPELGVTRYQSQFDQEKIRNWQLQVPGHDQTVFYDWMSLILNIVDPRVVDLAINEILDSAQMFGWRGARYDDHYTLWGKPYDAISTRNMQRIFDLGTQRHPGFTWGFNYLTMGTTCVWPGKPLPDDPWPSQPSNSLQAADPHEPHWQSMPEAYPEMKIAAANGAFFMNEEARSAQKGTYTDYARLLVHEARYIRNLGGHYGPIPFDHRAPSAFDAIFPDLLRLASRAHTYGDMWEDQRFRQFITRYSALIYGTTLTPLMDPESQLQVRCASGLWWHLFAYHCTIADSHLVLVHLLSAPGVDRINQNRSGLVPKLSGTTVAYVGQGTVTRAWELSPFQLEFSRGLACHGNQVEASDFHLWSMIVFEISGGAP
jgi:hypothetical protein